MPSTVTSRWYEAPPPGTASRAPSHVSTLDRVRSQMIGTPELIGSFGSSVTCASLGEVWQSVEEQYVSSPLLIVNTCAVVPALSVHAASPVFLIVTASSGCSPSAYSVLFVTASTMTCSGAHGPPATAPSAG